MFVVIDIGEHERERAVMRELVRTAMYNGRVVVMKSRSIGFSTLNTLDLSALNDVALLVKSIPPMRERCRAANRRAARRRWSEPALADVCDRPTVVPLKLARAPRRGPFRSRALLGRAHPLNRRA